MPGENGAAGNPPITEPVTPELVLVDPELARRARTQLADRPEFATRFGGREVAPAPPAWGPLFELAAQSEPRAERTPSRGRRRLVLAVVSAVLLGGVVVGAVLVVGYPSGTTNSAPAQPSREGPASDARTGASVPAAADPRAKRNPPAPAAAPGRRPAPPSRARAAQPAASPPRVFAWVPVATATHYRVRFFLGDAVIFQGWPSKPRLKLPSEWGYRGRRHRLGPGRYSWEVRPGYGRRGRARYGKPIVQARLVV